VTSVCSGCSVAWNCPFYDSELVYCPRLHGLRPCEHEWVYGSAKRVCLRCGKVEAHGEERQ